MAIHNCTGWLRFGLGLALLLPFPAQVSQIAAQTAAPATAAIPPKVGTVKAITGNTVTLATDAGPTVTISIPETVKVEELAVGSTDLKTAKPSQFTNIAVGDRVLAAVKPGDTPDSFTARVVVLMKSADIAQMQASQEADWKARGVGGIVSAVDPATGKITLRSGTKKIEISTTSATKFKRFAGDSVKYENAKPGTLAQIHVNDQLQARGNKSADGLSMQADEVVSGAFDNLSGVIASVDAATGTITLKDLATRRMMTVDVTANSDLHKMPLQLATAFAARANGGGEGGGGRRGGGGGGAAGGGEGGARRSAGADLSQMIPRLPSITLSDLKKGDAVMIVASEPSPGATTVTAITVLTGVEPILTANPNGGMDLSMSMGGAPSPE